jgi:hypothetical protein
MDDYNEPYQQFLVEGMTLKVPLWAKSLLFMDQAVFARSSSENEQYQEGKHKQKWIGDSPGPQSERRWKEIKKQFSDLGMPAVLSLTSVS